MYYILLISVVRYVCMCLYVYYYQELVGKFSVVA